MGTISVTVPNDGETIDASDVSTPINTIVNAINGNLDSNNLADDAATTAKIANDAVTDAKLVYGKVRSRQGGSATDWTSQGTTTYDYSGTNTFIQVGTIRGNTSLADKAVTFPTAFSQKPLVFITIITANSANSNRPAVNGITTTGFNIRTGEDSSNEDIAWMAIGQ